MNHPTGTSPPRTLLNLKRALAAFVCAPVCLIAFSSCQLSGDQGFQQTPRTAANTQKENTSPMSNAAHDQEVKANSDVNELRQYVNLPYEPASVLWQKQARGDASADRSAPGPSDWSIICLLQFKAEDAARIVGQTAQGQTGKTKKIKSQDWFPDAIKRTASPDNLIEGQSFDPAAFYKSPLTNGTLIRIGETNYFILGLYTM